MHSEKWKSIQINVDFRESASLIVAVALTSVGELLAKSTMYVMLRLVGKLVSFVHLFLCDINRYSSGTSFIKSFKTASAYDVLLSSMYTHVMYVLTPLSLQR